MPNENFCNFPRKKTMNKRTPLLLTKMVVCPVNVQLCENNKEK